MSFSPVQYVYDTPHVLTHNGLVSSRVVQAGMVASPVSHGSHTVSITSIFTDISLSLQYVQTPTHHMSGYQVSMDHSIESGPPLPAIMLCCVWSQVPVSQAVSTGTWQPAYYVQPSVSSPAESDTYMFVSHLL